MERKKILLICTGLLLLIMLSIGVVYATDQLNYDHEEYLEVVDLFWSVD